MYLLWVKYSMLSILKRIRKLPLEPSGKRKKYSESHCTMLTEKRSSSTRQTLYCARKKKKLLSNCLYPSSSLIVLFHICSLLLIVPTLSSIVPYF